MRSHNQARIPDAAVLRFARASIEHGLLYETPVPVDCTNLPTALAEPRATFTTLQLGGRLRGCCGSLEAVLPLARDVTLSAFRAAFRDARFPPVAECELGAIRLKISVLSPLEPIRVSSEADLLDQLTPGKDGLVIVAYGRRATFLPDVWDKLPDPRRFVSALRAKCGLPDDHWSDHLEFQRYRAVSIAE